MKKFIKILAVLLCISTILVNSIPSVSALGETEETTEIIEEETTQPPSEIPEEIPEEEEEITDEIPDEGGENEETTYPVTPEEETSLNYGEALLGSVLMGGQNIASGVGLLGATLISPLLFLAFPPIGVAAGLAGLPLGLGSILLGLAEIIGSPVIAFLVSDLTDLILI